MNKLTEITGRSLQRMTPEQKKGLVFDTQGEMDNQPNSESTLKPMTVDKTLDIIEDIVATIKNER